MLVVGNRREDRRAYGRLLTAERRGRCCRAWDHRTGLLRAPTLTHPHRAVQMCGDVTSPICGMRALPHCRVPVLWAFQRQLGSLPTSLVKVRRTQPVPINVRRTCVCGEIKTSATSSAGQEESTPSESSVPVAGGLFQQSNF